ncbi:Hypp3005 [Branchiostoma lanceolatum]|uniref:Hypp3005 protein n=1 Tax=Branchiostoma lanceolatum TaxID=7740 RepID=A0A8K0EVT1_BRALA|nr:Hypp3005 [Branchiostoma lanceolatum]
MDTTNPQHYSQNNALQHSVGVSALQQYMTWEEGDVVMDAGSGTGELCNYISQQPGVASVVGFDLSPDFISYARMNNSSPNVLYHVADASDPSTVKPEWRGSFSKVVSIFALQWIKDKATTLKVLNSCLKPGGEIVFVCDVEKSKASEITPALPKWKTYLGDADPNVFPWPSSDLTNDRRSILFLESCGFEVIACDISNYQYSFDSRDQFREYFRGGQTELHSIPEHKQEEFFDDLEKMAAERHWVTGEGAPTMQDVYLVVHARKM